MIRRMSELIAVALSLSCFQCANVRSTFRAAPTNAEELYQQSMDDMESGLYPEALKGFGDLKSKYPYTKYAALADLRTADTQLARAKYAEAIDAYRTFARLHPNHDQCPYAMMRIGEAYEQQIPEDWFFLPPAAEKDQGNTKLALNAYRDMLAHYPKAEVAEQAREHLRQIQLKLAEHEMYVAHFYYDRENYRAAAGRAEGILRNYDGLGLDEEALWLAGSGRFFAGELKEALPHLSALKARFPGSSRVDATEDMLRQIAAKGIVEEPSNTTQQG
jgi:outer membrane protein assembly factor BamD